ncbi:3474_t:CDS:1, partial [Scutellospora calospora]
KESDNEVNRPDEEINDEEQDNNQDNLEEEYNNLFFTIFDAKLDN